MERALWAGDRASALRLARSGRRYPAGAASLRQQVEQVNEAAVELGTLSEVLAQQVAAFKLAPTNAAAKVVASPPRPLATPLDLAQRRRVA